MWDFENFELTRGILRAAPFFSRIVNDMFPVYEESPEPVTKIGHGSYELPIDPNVKATVDSYKAWLRKARLDYALTLYLRGLNQL
jgi:hypothetical protein